MITTKKPILALIVIDVMYIVAIDGLQCPECTYMTTNIQFPGLKNILQTIIDTFSNPVCAKNIVDPSVTGIKYKTCREPASGHVNKCRHYQGQVTLKVYGQELILNTFERDCYEDTISNMPSDGCFQREDDPRDKSFFQNVMNQINTWIAPLDVVNFRGKMCVCSSTESDCQSGSQGLVVSVVLLIVSFIFILFLK